MVTVTPLPLRVDRTAADPLPAQIARQVRARIGSGTLAAGERLPSSRALARDLGVSRAVAEQAYDQLLAEGWVETRRGAGTYVADGTVLDAGRARPRTPAEPVTERHLVRLGTGSPWVDPKHDAGWRRAWREVSVLPTPREYPPAAGLPELRSAIAAYVGRTRGIDCGPAEVLVTLGTTDGLRHLLGVLPPGSVAVEDPGYRAAVATCGRLGRTVRDLPLDDEGASASALAAMPDDVRAVYVTPAHQHPTGITMTAPRRFALLAECRRRGALLVEDDYDSEFRYDVAPLPALATLDREQVVYLGTASKSVSPGLRLGWLIAPADLVSRISRQREEAHDVCSVPIQRAWLSMLRDGHVDKLVRSARRVYAVRSRHVAGALAPYGEVNRPAAGMYVTVALPPDVVDRVRRDCADAGYEVPSMADMSRSSGRSGLVVGFGGLTDEQLTDALAALTRSLAQALSG